MEKILLDCHAAPQLPPDFRLSYQIGNAFRGETCLVLEGTGEYRLRSNVTKGRQDLEFEGRLCSEKIMVLIRSLHESRLWESRSLPDRPWSGDVKIVIEVQLGDARGVAEIWASEVHDQPEFMEAQTAILDLVAGVSDKKILEEGR